MKDYEKLTYPQKGAYTIFINRLVEPKIIRPITKITCALLLLTLVGGFVSWIFWMGFLVSLAATIMAIVMICGIFWGITHITSRYYDGLFNEKVKNSLFWQDYFLIQTIKDYERAERDYPTILESLKPYDIPKDLSLYEEFAVLPYKQENARNAYYTAMAENNLRYFKAQYQKTLAHLAETNRTLSIQ